MARLEEIARLAYRSPRLVPLGEAYEGWLARVAAGELEARPEDAVALLGEAERRRLFTTCRALFGEDFDELAAGSDRRLVAQALLGGAVLAGVQDRLDRRLERFARRLDLIEQRGPRTVGPLTALSLVIDAKQLWSRDYGRRVERRLRALSEPAGSEAYELRFAEILRKASERSADEWHHLRLARLVRDVNEQLPVAGHPHATGALVVGCRRFDADSGFRAEFAARLLGQLVGRDPIRALRLAA